VNVGLDVHVVNAVNECFGLFNEINDGDRVDLLGRKDRPVAGGVGGRRFTRCAVAFVANAFFVTRRAGQSVNCIAKQILIVRSFLIFAFAQVS
jgi:hypothetical protein